MKPQFHKLIIKDIHPETNDCCSIAFEVPEHLKADYAFTQGQYLTLKADIDNEDVRRSYSICTSPLDEELKLLLDAQEFPSVALF